MIARSLGEPRGSSGRNFLNDVDAENLAFATRLAGHGTVVAEAMSALMSQPRGDDEHAFDRTDREQETSNQAYTVLDTLGVKTRTKALSIALVEEAVDICGLS